MFFRLPMRLSSEPGIESAAPSAAIIRPVDPTHRPHPEVPGDRRPPGLEGALQGSQRFLEGSFEAAAARPHLRMRESFGSTGDTNPQDGARSARFPSPYCGGGWAGRQARSG
ncbi:hypothetical protein FV241_18545, partial [Methylobacterium sp. WL2]